jgi:hypothetical protein
MARRSKYTVLKLTGGEMTSKINVETLREHLYEGKSESKFCSLLLWNKQLNPAITLSHAGTWFLHYMADIFTSAANAGLMQHQMENGNPTEQVKKCMMLTSSCAHQTQNPQTSTDCGCVWCRCDIHSVSVEMVPWRCKRLDECDGQEQMWSSFKMKQIFQSHRCNGVGGQMCITEAVTAGTEYLTQQCFGHCPWMSQLSWNASDGQWNYYMNNRRQNGHLIDQPPMSWSCKW